jgi:threonine dehydrogenase-like Zn-dependent dehydrogenase
MWPGTVLRDLSTRFPRGSRHNARRMRHLQSTCAPSGHDCGSEVTEVADESTSVQAGDRVVVPFQISRAENRIAERRYPPNS